MRIRASFSKMLCASRRWGFLTARTFLLSGIGRFSGDSGGLGGKPTVGSGTSLARYTVLHTPNPSSSCKLYFFIYGFGSVFCASNVFSFACFAAESDTSVSFAPEPTAIEHRESIWSALKDERLLCGFAGVAGGVSGSFSLKCGMKAGVVFKVVGLGRWPMGRTGSSRSAGRAIRGGAGIVSGVIRGSQLCLV